MIHITCAFVDSTAKVGKLLDQVTEPLSVETDFALKKHFGISSGEN